MGAAAYNRGSRLISAQLDREAEGRRRVARSVQALYVIEDAPHEPFTEPALEDAIHALVSLGLTRREAVARLEKIPDRATMPLSELLRRVLKSGDQ